MKLLETQFCVGEEYFTFHLYEGQIKRLISREDYGIDILYNQILICNSNSNYICRVTICSPRPKDLGYELNEPNTMNL